MDLYGSLILAGEPYRFAVYLEYEKKDDPGGI
jgi:hypothetical protein